MRPRRKRLAIIPRLLLSSGFVAVVPTCAIASCGDEGSAIVAADDVFQGDVTCCGDVHRFDSLMRDAAIDDDALADDADAAAVDSAPDAPNDATDAASDGHDAD